MVYSTVDICSYVQERDVLTVLSNGGVEEEEEEEE